MRKSLLISVTAAVSAAALVLFSTRTAERPRPEADYASRTEVATAPAFAPGDDATVEAASCSPEVPAQRAPALELLDRAESPRDSARIVVGLVADIAFSRLCL